MSYMSAIKKINRYNHAGGIFPSALNTTHALIAIISLIQKKAPSPKKSNKLILMFFYLWLTNNFKK